MSEDGLVASTALKLPTPNGVYQVLGLVGLSWTPQIIHGTADLAKLTSDPGLYIWVAGEGAKQDAMRAGGLYVGIGVGKEGLLGRVKTEMGLTDLDAWHGHGLAMARTRAAVVAGPVTWQPEPRLDWLDRTRPELRSWATGPAAWSEPWDEVLRRWLRSRTSEAAKAAEAIAIRAGIYLGDVGFPVNSSRAGAWEVTYGKPDKGREDAAAWAAVKHLRPETPTEPPA